MRRDLDGDQCIADAARPGQALSLQADLLAVDQPGRDLDVDLLAGGQAHAPGAAGGGFLERDGHGNGHVAAGGLAQIVRLEAAPERSGAPLRPAEATEHLADDRPRNWPPPTPPRALEALGAERKRLEMGVGAARRRARPAEALRSPGKRGLPSASISPASNALRFFSSPRIS